jgi:rubrerythrin
MSHAHETIGTPEVLDDARARALRDLVRLDVEAIDGIEAGHAAVRAHLESFRADHRRHVDELSSALRQAGHAVRLPRRDLIGLVAYGLTTLRTRFAAISPTESALRALRAYEQQTNERYAEALAVRWPPGVAALVRRMREDERRHLDYVETALRDRAWETGAHPSPA